MALALLAALAFLPTAASGAPEALAVFDVELLDTSGESEDPAEGARLTMLSDLLRERLAASEQYRRVDLAPVLKRSSVSGRSTVAAAANWLWANASARTLRSTSSFAR